MSKRKTYSREYKIGAIQMVEQKGMTMREASEALGINEGMLWTFLVAGQVRLSHFLGMAGCQKKTQR